MKSIEVTVVRIYLTEAEAKLNPLLKRLHDQEKVRGVTTFRGISGFGASGVMHTASLLDLSPDLPVVVEFFDEPARVEAVLQHLAALVEPGHIVHWRAHMVVNE
jgi:PII-like signaling protein